MIKDDEQYIDMLSSSERTIVFTTKFFLQQMGDQVRDQIKSLIRDLRSEIRDIISSVYGERFETYPYLNKYITQLYQTPQISTYALLVDKFNELINKILTSVEYNQPDTTPRFTSFVSEIQRFYNLMLDSRTRQQYNVAIGGHSGETSGDVTGSFFP